MAYRISYTRQPGFWEIMKLQSFFCVILLGAVTLCRPIIPESNRIFVSTPNPAQAVFAESYAGGERLRHCAVLYCAELLEYAGYEKETFH